GEYGGVRERVPVVLLQRLLPPPHRGRGEGLLLHSGHRRAQEAGVHPRVVFAQRPGRDTGDPSLPGGPQPGRDPQGRGRDPRGLGDRHVTTAACHNLLPRNDDRGDHTTLRDPFVPPTPFAQPLPPHEEELESPRMRRD
ncbi:unnamed protein product, partial [Ectocarpus sp. 12 AP-2014]